jgi:hypothetical protein
MEKRDLLQRVVCNPRLDGRTVRYELQKPFAILARMNQDGDWRPQFYNLRTAVESFAA